MYRCETAGKVGYSGSPCVGAKVIDATPNQGVDQMSGKSQKGRDVQRTEFNHALDDALRPLTGKSRDEMDVMRRRVKLPPRDQGECRELDVRLPGITRLSVLDLARGLGIAVQERAFTVEEAYAAKEAFSTSASSFVLPVVRIDDHMIRDGRPGRLSQELRALYIEQALREAS